MRGFVAPRILLWAAVASYGAGFAALSVLRHRAFNTGRFDLGNMVQAVWSTAHGDVLDVTALDGEQIVRLGAHADPLLVLLAPLWWLWPSPSMLLTVQAVGVALGAVPVFWLARKHLGSERAALGFALAYLLLPAVQWMTLSDFHAVALSCPLLLAAFWYLDEDRLAPFSMFAVLAAAGKEHVPLAVAGFGIWYAIARGRRRAGAGIVAAGVATTAALLAVVIPQFNDGRESDFYGRYDAVGGSPGGIARTAVTDPARVAAEAFDGRGVSYLVDLVAPLGGLPLLAPLAVVAAVPELALNLLSSARTQTSVHFHYNATVVAALVVAAVFGAARICRRRPHLRTPLSVGVAAATLVGNYALGAIPLWRHVPGGEQLQANAWRTSPHDDVARRAVELIPDAAPVTATNSLGAHLSERRRILSFPYVEDATWLAVDRTRPSFADSLESEPMERALRRIRRDGAWRLVFSEDGVLVFRRVD